MRSQFLLVGGVLGGLLLLAGLFGWLSGRQSPADPVADVTRACVQHTGIGMHIHPILRIVFDGQEQKIPADIGIVGPSCMRPLHTHDDSGTIHVEFPAPQDVRIGDFFRVWGRPFSRTQLLDRTVDDAHEVVLTVDGERSEEYENLLLRDRQDIVIEYRRKEAG